MARNVRAVAIDCQSMYTCVVGGDGLMTSHDDLVIVSTFDSICKFEASHTLSDEGKKHADYILTRYRCNAIVLK